MDKRFLACDTLDLDVYSCSKSSLNMKKIIIKCLLSALRRINSKKRNQFEREGHLKPVCVCASVRARSLIHALSFTEYNRCRRQSSHTLLISSKIICNANTPNCPLKLNSFVRVSASCE